MLAKAKYYLKVEKSAKRQEDMILKKMKLKRSKKMKRSHSTQLKELRESVVEEVVTAAVVEIETKDNKESQKIEPPSKELR